MMIQVRLKPLIGSKPCRIDLVVCDSPQRVACTHDSD